MDNKIKFVFLFFVLINLSSCYEANSHALLKSIKVAFSEKGKIVKVSDIHSGAWSKVCSSNLSWDYGDIRDVVEEFSGVEKSKIQILKHGDSLTYYNDTTWLLYFYYPPNKIEIHRISIDDMLIGHSDNNLDNYRCAKNENAYFVKGHYQRVDWDTYSENIDPLSDNFILTIIDTEK